MTPRIKRFSAFRLCFCFCFCFLVQLMVATCKHTALLGRYSRCIQEATLNTTNSWARGGNREHGAGDPRKASRACPDQAICLQGLRGQLGGRRHSRASGEGWRGEGQPSSASPPGEAGCPFSISPHVQFLPFFPLPLLPPFLFSPLSLSSA